MSAIINLPSGSILPHFDVFCDLLLNRRTATWNLFVLYNNEKPIFSLKYFNITRKPAFCGPAFAHLGEDEKKRFDVIYCLYKMKHFHWLLCVAKNLEENAGKSSQFLSSEQPCEPKSLDVALKIAGVEKNTVGKLVVAVNLEAI